MFEEFKKTYLEESDIQYTERQSIYTSYGMTARKKLIKDELLNDYMHMVLYYIRHYPTLELLAWQFNMYKQQAEKIISQWFKVLMKSLANLNVIPARDLNELAKKAEVLLGQGILTKEDLVLIIDVTERRINRSVSDEIQKRHYSGKKKCHTVKNTILNTVCLVVLFLGKTYEGKTHDFAMFKEEFTEEKWRKLADYKDLSYWVDLGYVGIKKWCEAISNIFIPHKKKRKSKTNPNPKLSLEQKAHNKFVSKTRIRGEHAIASIKTSKIVSHKFRGRKEGWNDQVMVAATAIHNFKLLF